MAFLIGGANSASGAYEISNSVRYNQGDSPELYFTPSSDMASRRTMTWSFWCKRGRLNGTGGYMFVMALDDDGAGFNPVIRFNDSGSGDTMRFTAHNESTPLRFITNAAFRDPLAWYHFVIMMDTSQSTNTNRLKLYINGTQTTDFSEVYYGTQNDDTNWGKGSRSHDIGFMDIASESQTSKYFDGYLADFYYINAQNLTASDFGELNDNGVWVPKRYEGTYNSDSFFLQFKQTGTSANASGIGADTSGEENHMTVANLAATDITTDTPTNNFCVWNYLEYSGDTALAEGNTEGYTRDGTADYHEGARGTMAVSNGKWYWEVKMVEVGDTSNALFAGIMSADHSFRNGEEDELLLGTYGMRNSDGDSVISNGSALAYATYGASFSDGDILNFALDMDNNRLYIGKGGSWADGSGNIDEASINSYLTLSTTPSAYMPMVIGYSTGADIKYQANFGNAPYSISSGNADANGYGNFEYAVPSGFYALCTKNLAEYG